jgi:hypothetical protein
MLPMEIGETTMAPQIKPLPYGAKLGKLYAGKFYLPKDSYADFIAHLEGGTIRNNREAIDYVEEYGSWLD